MGKTMVFFYISIGNGFHSHFHFLLYHYHWMLLTIPFPVVSIPISISYLPIPFPVSPIQLQPFPFPLVTIPSAKNFRQIPPEKFFSLKFELSTTQFKINHTGVYFIHPPQKFYRVVNNTERTKLWHLRKENLEQLFSS